MSDSFGFVFGDLFILLMVNEGFLCMLKFYKEIRWYRFFGVEIRLLLFLFGLNCEFYFCIY